MAVLNQRDYKSAKARLAQIQAALGQEAVFDSLKSNLSADVAPARRDALRAEAQRLQEEIGAYENLQTSQARHTFSADDDLGILPILGRIARCLSQREMGDLLGVSEQQIQRYESDRYAGVSLSRYKKIMEILGIDLHSRLKTAWSTTGATSHGPQPHLELDSSLISELRKNNWVQLPKGITKENAGHILAVYVSESADLSRGRALHRRNAREETPLNDAAIAIWQARALRQATFQRQKIRTKFNIVDTTWLAKLATLSTYADGPLRAIELLREHGIAFAIVPQLPKCRLDGAAMLLADGTPAVVLTLRYDRVDSFWFTLFHELGHVLLHFNHGLDIGFVDNLDVSGTTKPEREADLFAQSALIPEQTWETSPARFSKSPDMVRKLAQTLGIHPSIVAGRIRKERSDYTIFTDLVGNGEVYQLFTHEVT